MRGLSTAKESNNICWINKYKIRNKPDLVLNLSIVIMGKAFNRCKSYSPYQYSEGYNNSTYLHGLQTNSGQQKQETKCMVILLLLSNVQDKKRFVDLPGSL